MNWMDGKRWLFGAGAARLSLGVALLAITTLALIPQAQVPVTTLWDKADHALAFFVLGLLTLRAFPTAHFARVIAPALLGYGAMLELLQALTLTRVGSFADLLADAAGLLLAGVAIHLHRSAGASPATRQPDPGD